MKAKRFILPSLFLLLSNTTSGQVNFIDRISVVTNLGFHPEAFYFDMRSMPTDEIYSEYLEDKDHNNVERYGHSTVNSVGLLFGGPVAFNPRSKKKYRYSVGLNYMNTGFYSENASLVLERESGKFKAGGGTTRYAYKRSYLGIPLQITRSYEKRRSSFELGISFSGNFLVSSGVTVLNVRNGEVFGTKEWDPRSQATRDYWLSAAATGRYAFNLTDHFGLAANLHLGITPMNLIRFDDIRYNNMVRMYQPFDTWEKSRTLNPFVSGGLEVFYTW